MQQTYPHVTVECQTFGWGEYWEKFDVAFAAGVVPDIMLMTPERMPKYSKAGGLLDLWDISETLGLKAEDYYESSIEAFTTVENKLEAWPNSTYAVGFGVNLGNVREQGVEGMLPPGPDYQLKSFDDTMELLKALTYERNGQQVWGTIWTGGGGAVSQWPYTGSVVWGHGADWICDRGRADEVCLDTEAGIAAIKWIEDSIFTHKVAPEGMAVATGNEINDLWFRSRLSLYHSAWGGGMQGQIQEVKKLQEAGEDVPDLEVQLMRPPAVEGAEPAVVADPTGFSLPKTNDAVKQQWAAEFMRLMVTGDAVDDGRPYYLSAHLATAKQQQELDPYLAYEAEYLIPIGRPRGAHPKYAEIANLWQQEIQAVLAGTKHADEAVTSFAEAARIALREA
jgi:ABC-type glycerol-3-phosphate transport system substrate-binding protein